MKNRMRDRLVCLLNETKIGHHSNIRADGCSVPGSAPFLAGQ